MSGADTAADLCATSVTRAAATTRGWRYDLPVRLWGERLSECDYLKLERRGAFGARACGQGPCGAASQELRYDEKPLQNRFSMISRSHVATLALSVARGNSGG